ncbi:MAG: hypothetical protein ACLQSR_01905, partial [Limisphaerales bacterium]
QQRGVAVNRNKAGRHEFQTRTPCGSSICLTKNAFSKSDRLLATPISSLHQWRKNQAAMVLRWPKLQFGIWVALMIASTLCLFCGKMLVMMLLLVCAQLFPKYKLLKKRI